MPANFGILRKDKLTVIIPYWTIEYTAVLFKKKKKKINSWSICTTLAPHLKLN